MLPNDRTTSPATSPDPINRELQHARAHDGAWERTKAAIRNEALEEAAKVCDGVARELTHPGARDCAAAIRARIAPGRWQSGDGNWTVGDTAYASGEPMRKGST